MTGDDAGGCTGDAACAGIAGGCGCDSAGGCGAGGVFCCADVGGASDSIANAKITPNAARKGDVYIFRPSTINQIVAYASGQRKLLRDAESEAARRLNWRADARPVSDFAERSMSADRRSARLKRDASGVQIDESGVGGQIQEGNSLRSRQIRRCRNHHCVGQR